MDLTFVINVLLLVYFKKVTFLLIHLILIWLIDLNQLLPPLWSLRRRSYNTLHYKWLNDPYEASFLTQFIFNWRLGNQVASQIKPRQISVICSVYVKKIHRSTYSLPRNYLFQILTSFKVKYLNIMLDKRLTWTSHLLNQKTK